MIRWLPPEAIKVLAIDRATDKVVLRSQSCPPEEAFFYIGEPAAGKITVVVEDELAKHVVNKALKRGGESFANRFEVKFYPGGSETMWSHIQVFSADDSSDRLALFDGDKRPPNDLPDPASVPETESGRLKDDLKSYAGRNFTFNVDGGKGGGNKSQIDRAVRNLVRWVRDHVDYLPGKNLEAFIWDNMDKRDSEEFEHIADPKLRFNKLALKELDRASYESVSSQEILGTQLRRLKTVPTDHPDLVQLYRRLAKAVGS
jgi:hypothetical protein